MYAALDLHQRTVQLVLKDERGQIANETKTSKDANNILEFQLPDLYVVFFDSHFYSHAPHVSLNESQTGFKQNELRVSV